MHDAFAPLQGLRILSLALNLPGPAALLRCRRLGARCTKLEPPAGDPMARYNARAYRELHDGVQVLHADLKTAEGQQQLQRELADSDVLLTSFRPSALRKLGLAWEELHRQHPGVSQVAIVGAAGERAEEPGHDLTYLAEHDLVTGLDLPATLYADMSGALLATEAVLQAALRRSTGKGMYLEVPLADAAAWLALPRVWGLTQASGAVGGAHAGYRVYACLDGRVAVAALEPHFAQRLCALAGAAGAMTASNTHERIAAFFAARTREEVDALAKQHDLPLHTME